MDQELREYLDGRFEEIRQDLAETHRHGERTDQRLQQTDQRLQQTDQRLEKTHHQVQQIHQQVQQNHQQIQQTDQQLQDFRRESADQFAEVNRRLDRGEEERRLTHVLIEDLQRKLEIVVEGVVGIREHQDRFQGEMREELGEVRQLIGVSYSHLDRRLRALESH